jgi:RND family efflux transporter MFP subunit
VRGLTAGVVAVALAVLAVVVLVAGRLQSNDQTTPIASPPGTPTAITTARPTPTPSPRPSPTPTPTATATPIDPAVVGAGIVVPRRSADLALPITAPVTLVAVREEEEVFTGELLVRVDQSTRQAAVEVAMADVERAEAAVDRARLQLEQLPLDAGPAQRESAQADLRLAQAELGVARTTLAEAELALTQTELRAPFAGTVAWIGVSVGEQAIAGEPVISLGDLSGWFIQTTDLSELNVLRLSVGDRAEVTFDALPDLVLPGTVDQIQVRGTAQQGGVRFDVFIRPDEHHPELRWNMSANVRITPAN